MWNCGICNFFNKPNKEIVKLMNKAIHHRGPDDEGYFNNETIILVTKDYQF